MKTADSVVECQTRYTAEQEGRRVEDMRDEIQHLRPKDRGDIEHVLYKGKMPAGAQDDELNAYSNEAYQQGLVNTKNKTRVSSVLPPRVDESKYKGVQKRRHSSYVY